MQTSEGKAKTILFTGFPGFIGKRLVYKIAAMRPQARWVFLVLDKFVEHARIEAKGLQAEIIPGDISRPFLGLSEAKYREILSEITDIFHLAAVYDLAVPRQIAYEVNVTGTRNVLEFSKQAQNLKALVYFSTCYVAGRSSGTVYEDELPTGQSFKNHYEATKHEAERLVRDAMPAVPTIIIRPAVVVGDSRTGETPKFDGPFFGMIMADRLKKLMLPIPYVGSLRAHVNIVPIDYVVDGTAALWLTPDAVGKCYALADPHPVPTRKVYRMTIDAVGARGPWGKVPPVLMETLLAFKAARKWLGVPREVVEYYNHGVRFDTANATRALEKAGIHCPPFLTYYGKMLEFYQNNKHRPELYWQVY